MSPPPSSGRPTPRTRPPLERMMRIHRAIQGGTFPNATALAGTLEVSTKSIHRDLEFMRDRLQLPLEFDARKNGYHYTEDVSQFPTLQITEGELFALLVAEKALQQYRGTTFEKPLVGAFRKMCETLPDAVSFNISDWENTISFRTSAQPHVNLEVFGTLSQATSRHCRIRLSYRKPGGEAPEERIVDPYHLANINGEWFLFAWCHRRKDFRTFVPARMEKVELLDSRFKPAKKFDLNRRLRDSFGVHSSEGEYAVRIRFDETAAVYIREKQWHASQILREEPDGSVVMEMTLSSLIEIQRWILSWGTHARVLSPPDLVDSIRVTALTLLKNHPVKS